MSVFNKKEDADQEPVGKKAAEPTAGKGRPTPKRKDAQAQNLRPLVPKDREASRKAAKARMRERENAEYDAAKEMQGHIEGRIAELEGKIPMLQIIDPKTLQAGERIVFGATVELEDEDSGNTKSYQIVGDDEADIKENRISISSPLARSLIGKFEGDEVTCPAPKGLIHYAIISVKYV